MELSKRAGEMDGDVRERVLVLDTDAEDRADDERKENRWRRGI